MPRTSTRPRIVPASGSCAVKFPIMVRLFAVALYAVLFTVIALLVCSVARSTATMMTVTTAMAIPTASMTSCVTPRRFILCSARVFLSAFMVLCPLPTAYIFSSVGKPTYYTINIFIY